MGFSLTILAGPEKGREFSFDRIQVTIGRTMDNDVVLPDPGISRQHLSIRDKGGAYIVKDLGSSNGTQVNGQPILEEVLKPGDVIVAGGAQIRFDGPTDGGAEAKKPAASKRAGRGRGAAARRGGGARGGRPSARAAAARRGRAAGAKGARGRAAEARGRRAGNRAAADEGGGGGGIKIKSAGMRKQKKEPAPEPDLLEQAAEARGRGGKKKGKGAQAPAKASPLGRVKAWIRGLSKGKKIALFSVFGLLLVVLIAGAFKGGHDLVVGMKYYDDETLSPGERSGNRPISYGLGLSKRKCLYRAAFQFKYASGRAKMVYMVGGIDTKQEVEILLNGMHVDYSPLTLEGWSQPNTISLPRKHLLENDFNVVEFINTVNRNSPEAREEWGVAVLEIVEQPLPPPDAKKAEVAFTNANERYKNKGVSPGNLYRAMQFFQETMDYLELLPPESRSDIYVEAKEMIDKIDAELNALHRSRTFDAEKLFKYGQKEEAKNIFRVLMLTFPNQNDPRHKQAKEAYMRLGGSLQEITH